MKKRVAVFLLLVSMFVSMFPVMYIYPEKAEAATVTYIPEVGEVKLAYKGPNHEFYWDENGNLIYQASYYHKSSATITYRTTGLYFLKEPSHGEPGAFVPNKGHLSAFSETFERIEGDTAYMVVIIRRSALEYIATSLFGSLEAACDQPIYVSQQFCLMKRDNASIPWNKYLHTIRWGYDSCAAIQGAANWTSTTYNNFPDYYDNPIIMDVKGYSITVETSSGGDAWANKCLGYSGNIINLTAVPYENYTFAGWEVVSGDVNIVSSQESETSFQMPACDVAVKANFKPKKAPPTNTPTIGAYRIIVEAGEGGTAKASHTYADPSTKITLNAYPDAGYEFDKWELVSSGGRIVNLSGTTSAEASFTMPVADVTLRATFKAGPSPTPAPTPTTAPYFPSQNINVFKENYRYYTTDEGYTMEKIYNTDGPVLDSTPYSGTTLKTYTTTKLSTTYLTGTDSSGNTWFFIPNGTKALSVHPNVYDGYSANTDAVKNITELVFPGSITYNGTSYTVATIGGGGRYYHADDDKALNGQTGYSVTLYSMYGSHTYWSNTSNTTSGTTYDYNHEYTCKYAYGVVGNGFISSSEGTWQNWYQSSEERHSYYTYAEDYYVYNTTLKSVTIPSSVTAIEPYAFYGCQALTQVEGASNVTSIGKYAFSAGDARNCKRSVIDVSGNYKNYFYNEDQSYTANTEKMNRWQGMVAMSEHIFLPAFSSLRTISDRAFFLRDNLNDVVLPATVTTIDTDAFAGSELNSIKIPNKATVINNTKSDNDSFAGVDGVTVKQGKASTLGAKTNPIEEKTVIITVPESKALEYGLVHEDFYDIQAGYNVTYHKNTSPAESKTVVTDLEKVIGVPRAAMDLKNSNGNYQTTAYITENGDLFLYHKNDVMATHIAPDVKFTELKTYGNFFMAFGVNGEIWASGTADPYVWTDIEMPEGAHSYQFSGGNIYYIDVNGQICVTSLINSSENKVVPRFTQIITYGSSVKYTKFIIENEGNVYTTNSTSVTFNGESSQATAYFTDGTSKTLSFTKGNTYSYGAPPQIIALSEEKSLIKFNAYPNNGQIGFYYSPTPDCLATDVTDFVLLEADRLGDETFISISGSTGRYGYFTVVYTDSSGKLYRAKRDLYQNGRSNYQSELLDGGSCRITKAEDPIVFYKNTITGQLGVVYNYKSGNIYTVKNTSIPMSYSDDVGTFGEGRYFYTPGGTIWSVSWSSFTPSISGAFNGAKFKKLITRGNGAYEKSVLLLEDGALYGKGYCAYGELGLSSGTYSSFNKSATGGVVFDDICFASDYFVLAVTTDGTKYGAGYSYDAFGNYSNVTSLTKLPDQSYPIPISTGSKLTMEAVTSFITKLKYRHTFFGGDLFFVPGLDLLYWNSLENGTGVKYMPNTTVYLTEPLTVYGQWSVASKTVMYLPNGGVGTMKNDVYDVSVTSVTLRKNNPPNDGYIRNGYGFVGWSYKAEPEPTDEIIPDGGAVEIGLGKTRLYAQWEPILYTVRVGSEDECVEEQHFTDYILGIDEELNLGAKEDKFFMVSYDLNDKETQPSMHAKAAFATELTKNNTEALLEFYGWCVYEDSDKNAKITTVDRYVGFYSPDAVVKNLATKKGAVFYAFPRWGGIASYVQLPEIVCEGYSFLGYTPGKAYAPDYFRTPEAFVDAIQEGILVQVSGGSGTCYQPKTDGEVLYAYYKRDKPIGSIYGFEVYDVFGTPAWEEIGEVEIGYTIGKKEEDSDFWNTLPLRTGVHPLYCNLGGLPLGGGFSFRVVSTGDFSEEDTILTIIPYFVLVNEEGYREVDLYFEKETEQGRFLQKWSAEEQKAVLYANKDVVVGADALSKIWSGDFRVPDALWVAESGTNVLAYQQQFGLSFKESFWLKDARLMLRFTLCVENGDGEFLYYGMLPEEVEENVWVQEAGEPYREDYDKNHYKLYGGEVAVIYPGDNADKWNSIHGIY